MTRKSIVLLEYLNVVMIMRYATVVNEVIFYGPLRVILLHFLVLPDHLRRPPFHLHLVVFIQLFAINLLRLIIVLVLLAPHRFLPIYIWLVLTVALMLLVVPHTE